MVRVDFSVNLGYVKLQAYICTPTPTFVATSLRTVGSRDDP